MAVAGCYGPCPHRRILFRAEASLFAKPQRLRARVRAYVLHVARLGRLNFTARFLANSKLKRQNPRVKYWEIIADNLSKAGWSWGLCLSR